MLDPYKMIFINSIFSALIILGFLFYKYIYPKKKINLLLLLISFSLVVCISIFRNGVYESGDFMIHLYRTIDFYTSLQEGNILPSWAGNLNATYGYPLFILNYPLPYYIISFFHLFHISFIDSLKLFLAFNFVTSGIFMYFCAKKLFRNDTAAFVTSIFYQFAPYHLIDLHFKVVIGEIMIFTFLPFTLYALLLLWQKRSLFSYSLMSFALVLLILSHVVLALFAIGLFFCYAIFLSIKQKNKNFITSLTLATIIGGMCTLYVWLTPFVMTKYTLFKSADNFAYFPQFIELLFAPWRFGFLFQGPMGEISFLLGYAHIFIFIFLLGIVINNKLSGKHKSAIFFWMFALITIIFFITPLSKPLWGVLPFLKITGSHRLLLLAAFVSSLLAGYLCLQILKRKRFILILVIVAIFSTLLNWGHRRVIPNISDQDIIRNVPSSTAQTEGHFYANSKWRSIKDPWFKSQPKSPLEFVKGSGEIKQVERNSTYHSYVISAQTPIQLKENTLYFPGWQATVNKKSLPIQPNSEGVITFQLAKGIHFIEIFYADILIYKILKIISVTFLIGILGIMVLTLIKTVKKKSRILLARFSGYN